MTRSVVVMALLSCSISSSALAQATATSDSPGAFRSAPFTGDEQSFQGIVATAQRHAERTQDVSVAVSAVTGSQLPARGFNALDTLGTAVPSLQVAYIGFGFTRFLRGGGSTSSAPNTEASVATHIDGVYHASIIGKSEMHSGSIMLSVSKCWKVLRARTDLDPTSDQANL